MKIKNLLIVLLILSINKTVAQAPLAGCWHPDFIKDWTPEKDPDRKFNRSTVPLQPRIPVAATVKAHSQQYPQGQVAACLTMHPMCSQVPAQGAYNFIGYNPTYWQYMDLLIWWGGSAGEGIILPPSAPVIDAAHMSGVKVLGQIFYPPTAFSGLPAWTTQMNSTTGDGVYPYARKCAEIAKYYGFDGWFVNSETITSTSWTAWTADYLRYAEEIGLTGQEIQLYDMSTSCTSEKATGVARQKGGSFMANYGGTNNVIAAVTNHTNEAEWGNKFESWYAGQEQSGSITANGSNVKNLFKTTGHVGSVNFFNPEEKIWKNVVSGLLNTPNASGTSAYTAMQTVFNNEKIFWTNSAGNVMSQSRGTTSTMPGLATMIQERSAIQGKPFVSTFSAGLGKHWFVNGEIKGTQDWYHRGMQTVLPTWRWWALKGTAFASEMQFGLNWDDAYNIGTSVNITGNLTDSTNYVVNLYKTKIAIEEGDRVEFVYKTNVEESLRLRFGTEATTAVTAMYQPVSTTSRNGWTIDTYDLTPLAGQDLRMISFNLNPYAFGAGYTARLGQLAVYPANYSPSAQSVGNLEIQNDLGPTQGDLRVIWDHPADISSIHHYNVYLTRNGETKLAGQTRNEGFYIHKFNRTGLNETELSVQVVPVYTNMEEATGMSVSVSASYPQIDLPEVTLLVSKSNLLPDEEVTFTVEATNFPEQYNWEEPAEGVGTLVTQNGSSAVYKFHTEGKHNVAVSVTNAIGTTRHLQRGAVNVQTAELVPVSRAAKGGSVAGSFSGYDTNSYMTASGEHPGWLIDESPIPSSLGQKWCAGGEKEHWVIVTLDKIYELYRFMIYDCGHKENAADNLTYYKIYTSVDKVNWELALDKQNVPATADYNTKDHYVAPVYAKYVKFVPYDPNKAITIRVWQFDVYGKEGVPTPSLKNLKANKRLVQTNEEVTLTIEASQNPSSYNWQVSNATKVSQIDTETGSTAVFTFAQEGTYDVVVVASNEGGEKYFESKKILQVSNTQSLISVNKPVILTSLESTNAHYLTDGVTEPIDIDEKWTASDDAEYWAIIDLQSTYSLSRFITFDSRTMEPVVLTNINHYNIFVANSIDAQGNGDWQLAVRGRNAAGKNIKDDILTTPVVGRYVKFNPYDWRLFDVKVYELEMYGSLVGSIQPQIDAAENQGIVVGQTRDLTVNFTMNGNAVETNFGITVVAEHPDVVQVSNKVIDGNQVSFTIQGLKTGSTKVKVALTNGTSIVEVEFTVEVTFLTNLNTSGESTVKVWPNPVRSGDAIQVEADGSDMIRIFSVDGKLVKQQPANQKYTTVSTADMSRGVYFIHVTGSCNTVSRIVIR